MTKTRLTLTAVALCGLLLPFAGCDSAENPIAPSNSVLFITANPTEIGLNGSSTITVTGFKPDNNPLNPGTLVTLSTSIGVLDETVLQTDSQGRVSTTLRGNGVAGTATVQAQVSGGGGTGGGGDGEGGGTGSSSGATASTSVQIGEPEGSQPTVVITANPSIVPVGGRSTISLLGRSADGSPVAPGQRIRLTADLGTLRCQEAFFCPDTVSGSDCNAVCTDSNGEAEAIYVAGDRAGNGLVSAILGTSMEAMVTITIRDAPATLDFRADPRTVTQGGDRTISLTATVLNAQGDPVAAASVTFGADIGGTFASGSGLNTTNPQGIATDTLTVPEIELENRTSFNVTATVRGEGAEISETLAITILQQ